VGETTHINRISTGKHGKLAFSEDILKVSLIDYFYAFGILWDAPGFDWML